MRLIDAEELGFEILENTSDQDETANMIYGFVINAPTVDAVPVRHGRWENFGEGYALCSECGETTPWMYALDYCGHCGAKMEEGDETD